VLSVISAAVAPATFENISTLGSISILSLACIGNGAVNETVNERSWAEGTCEPTFIILGAGMIWKTVLGQDGHAPLAVPVIVRAKAPADGRVDTRPVVEVAENVIVHGDAVVTAPLFTVHVMVLVPTALVLHVRPAVEQPPVWVLPAPVTEVANICLVGVKTIELPDPSPEPTVKVTARSPLAVDSTYEVA
jgi:hypothetical protein